MSAWYSSGLHFTCTQCGNCCTGPQGYVWLSPRDQKAIAEFLGLDLKVFRKRYTRLVGTLLSLVDKPNGDCIFLTEDKRCAIQSRKPRQCLTFPFWPRILASRRAWEQMGESCPGMGHGAFFKPEEVDTLVDRETPRELVCKLMGKTPPA